jgi:uncharacterized integral membrane protein
MKAIKKIILIVIVVVLIVFASQNFETAVIKFLRWRIEMPIAVLILGIYALGAVTGGIVFSGLKLIFKNPAEKKIPDQGKSDQTVSN